MEDSNQKQGSGMNEEGVGGQGSGVGLPVTDHQSPIASLIQATPSSMVPPGSANPTQGAGEGIQSGGGKIVLPEKEDRRTEEDSRSSVAERLEGEIVPVEVTSSEQSSDVSTESIELPDLTQEQVSFLISDRYREASSMIKREFGMEDDDLSFLSEMEHAVLGGIINLEQFISALREEFPRLNDAEKDRLIGILLAYRFEPFSDQLHPTPREAGRMMNVKIATAPYYRVYTKPLTYRGAANEVARMANIDLMGQTQERLRDAIISRMKGIRTDGQLEELFMRPPEQAGLGLSEERARIARESLVELIERARLMSEDEYARWLNDQIHQKKVTETPPAIVESKNSLHEDEEKEIADITRRMPESSRKEETTLTRVISLVIAGLSWKPTDEYLMRRLQNIVSTRLRDVRSRNEVFIKLMRDDNVGGLGLERKQAEEVAEEIENGYRTYRGTVADDESKKFKQQLVEQEQKIQERRRKDSEEHAKWFEEKIKNKQDSAKSGLELLKVIARGQTSPIHPLDAKEDAKERSSFGQLVASSGMNAVSDQANAMQKLAVSFHEDSSSSKKAQTTLLSTAPTHPSRSAPASVVKVSVETARATQQAQMSSKPKMQDVTPMKTIKTASSGLSGPLQEISQMTLENFRRLASNPKASSQRLQDIANVLGQESYEHRISAITAWKSSPLQRMYLELVAGAFLTKKSITEVADAKRAKGELAPTPEEINAIVELNRILSF
jgi:hypothetical protein